MDRIDKVRQFLDLHRPGTPLLLPNPWDVGSSRLIASMGFEALATTSSGFAGTLGRHDGNVTRDEALSHAAAIANATSLPISADLENGFGHDPMQVADTVRRAAAVGLAGCSIEDFRGDEKDPIYDASLAAERVAAAAEVARAESTRIVLTARAENHLHGRDDLDDTIVRLQAYERAGADCVYAPGLTKLEDIERVVSSVAVPVNVLLRRNGPGVTELAAAKVARISIGGAFYQASLAAVEQAAKGFLRAEVADFLEQADAGRDCLNAFD